MQPFSLNLRGQLRTYTHPAVMGIINATADSFHPASRVADARAAAEKARRMADEGADFIDVGASSTRPGSEPPAEEEEIARLRAIAPAIREAVPGMPLSVDTFRAGVARTAVEELGFDMVNDVSGGNLDPEMYATVAALRVPYILGHMRGRPADMMDFTTYEDVTRDVLSELGDRLQTLDFLGVADVILDPGFGFSKTLEQNYELMRHLELLGLMHRPIMVGVSRKSMITKLLGVDTGEALAGTVALNTIAVMKGASILRVHDVRPAAEAILIARQFLTPHS